jgi:hypothetical protein
MGRPAALLGVDDAHVLAALRAFGIEPDAPDGRSEQRVIAARGRAFARFETRFQVAWVIGALVGIIPQNPKVGMLLLALTLGVAGVLYVAARRAARGLHVRTSLRPPAVDRALGRATAGFRVRMTERRHRKPGRGRERSAKRTREPTREITPEPIREITPEPIREVTREPTPEVLQDPPDAFPGGS